MILPVDQDIHQPPSATNQVLVRFGAIPQVVRCSLSLENPDAIRRGTNVVVATDRGEELGSVLEVISDSPGESPTSSVRILRPATLADEHTFREHQDESAAAFPEWMRRIEEWSLDLQLVDIERPLAGDRLILYVLNERGAETTRMALLAAAAGLGIITVQPVSAEGIVVPSGGGGCGSGCGCGTGHE